MKSISCILHKLVHDLLSCQDASFDTFFIIININAQVQRMVVAHTRSELKKMQSYQQQQLYLKTVSIHNYLQLTEIKNILFKKEPVILIARLTPLMLEDPEEGGKLLNDLYSPALRIITPFSD